MYMTGHVDDTVGESAVEACRPCLRKPFASDVRA